MTPGPGAAARRIEELLRGPTTTVSADDLAALRAGLEQAAVRALELVEGHDADEVLPLRLPKARVVAMTECERGALARSRGGSDRVQSAAALAGRALDVFVEHEILVGPVGDPTEDLLAWLAARGEDDVRDQVIAALADGPALPLDALAAAARAWADTDPAWWPRTQAAAAVHLAGGAVRCDGYTDVELGGPLAGRPTVVVEVKTREHRTHLAEVTHYALLVALRDGVAPVAVARWYPGVDLATQAVTHDVLVSAARRLTDVIGAWAELQVGRPPVERPGPSCGWCPDADRCPSFVEPSDPLGVGVS